MTGLAEEIPARERGLLHARGLPESARVNRFSPIYSPEGAVGAVGAVAVGAVEK